MRRAAGALGVVGVVLISTFGAARLWLESCVPPLGGRETIPGLADSVTVLWDSLAVPHVVARSEGDLFAAIGYLHARDRLWQMDLLRHAAEGRLSELFGSRTVEVDRNRRALEIPRIARAKLAAAGPAAQQAVEAYARGVNAWIARRNRALEFRLRGHEPEPWRPEHTYEIGGLQAWDLHTSGDELSLAAVAARLGPERARQLVPEYPDTAPTIVSGTSPRAGAGRPQARAISVVALPAPRSLAAAARFFEGPADASNAWAIGPRRTASGKPILANDPHLTLRAPSIWYLVGAHAPGYEVVGATIPGVPIVVLGHNRHLAWGFTNAMVDDVDFVIEQLNADSSRYRTRTGWAPVEAVAETIAVKGGRLVTYSRRRTAHGPLVATEWRPDSGWALACRWVAQDAASDEIGALLGMGAAADWAGFSAALQGFRSPEQNVVYADAAGNIAYTLAGHIPVRASGEGLFPTPGWTDAGKWERFLTTAELPRVVNPSASFIVTANNRVVGRGYPHYISRSWDLPYRAERITELLRPDSGATARSVARAQRDVVDVFARRVSRVAARAARAAGRADVADRLRAWDGAMATDRPEPTLVWSWYRELQWLTYADESPDYRPPAPLDRWLAEGTSPWFDDVRTPERETLETLARRAMDSVLARADGVRWGDAHRTLMAHPLGAVPLLGRLLGLSIGPLPNGGDDYTVNAAASSERAAPFWSDWGPSMRHVVDFGDVDGVGGFILPAGQSGHPLSRHYRDQTARWQRGDLWILPLDVRKVLVVDTLTLGRETR